MVALEMWRENSKGLRQITDINPNEFANDFGDYQMSYLQMQMHMFIVGN